MDLDGAVCLITGGGSGIGRATALLMARRGAKVALAGRTASKVDSVRGELEAIGGVASSYSIDVSDREAVFGMVAEIERALGAVAVLVNSAGHSSQNRKLATTTPQEIRGVMASSLEGAVYCSQAVIEGMLEAGQGTIVNISSVAGTHPTGLAGIAYGAAKAAVINFTRNLNAEFGETRIRASVLIPGEVDTPMIDLRPFKKPSADARARMVRAEEVAEAIVMIASLSPDSNIPEMVIRPTVVRDRATEMPQV